MPPGDGVRVKFVSRPAEIAQNEGIFLCFERAPTRLLRTCQQCKNSARSKGFMRHIYRALPAAVGASAWQPSDRRRGRVERAVLSSSDKLTHNNNSTTTAGHCKTRSNAHRRESGRETGAAIALGAGNRRDGKPTGKPGETAGNRETGNGKPGNRHPGRALPASTLQTDRAQTLRPGGRSGNRETAGTGNRPEASLLPKEIDSTRPTRRVELRPHIRPARAPH